MMSQYMEVIPLNGKKTTVSLNTLKRHRKWIKSALTWETILLCVLGQVLSVKNSRFSLFVVAEATDLAMSHTVCIFTLDITANINAAACKHYLFRSFHACTMCSQNCPWLLCSYPRFQWGSFVCNTQINVMRPVF